MKNLLTAVGALTVGAAAMYLADPDQGHRRRALLRRQAAAAAQDALDVMERSGRQAAGRLQDVAQEGREAGLGLLHRAGTLARDVALEGREAGLQGLQRVRSLARTRRERLSADAEGELLEPWRPGLGAALLAAVGGLAVGAAAMFLLDPQQGRRRLALARDQAVHLGRTGACFAQVGLRDLGHRAKGLAARTTSLMRRDAVDDAVLAERVRAALGRVVSHPHAVRVGAAAGCVTLAGPVLADERAPLLKCVRSVRGVREVRDTLDAYESAGHEPALQGGTQRSGPHTEFMQAHWAPGPRLLALAGGAALGCYAASRRGMPGLLAGAIGAGLALRAARNEELGHTLTRVTRRHEAEPIGKPTELGAPAEPWHPGGTPPETRSGTALH